MNATRALNFLPLLLLLGGCNYLGGSTMDTLVAHSDVTKDILDIYGRIFWWTAFLFVGVQGALIYAVLRFRARGDEKTLPAQTHGHTQLELLWTVLPVFILMDIAIPTVTFVFKSQAPVGEDGLIVHSVGKQWWFYFEYPKEGIITANEFHVPLGRDVEVRLQSDNVIHSFFVPQLVGKRDMVPGRVNKVRFKADKVGTFLAQCAEYCGDSHALMRFRAVVDTPEDFEKWVKAQTTPADTTSDAAVAGFAAYQQAGCVACHAIDGTTSVAQIGPNLTHVASRDTIAAGVLDNNADNLRKWIADPQAIKPGSKMTNLHLTKEQLDAVVPYLQSLK